MIENETIMCRAARDIYYSAAMGMAMHPVPTTPTGTLLRGGRIRLVNTTAGVIQGLAGAATSITAHMISGGLYS